MDLGYAGPKIHVPLEVSSAPLAPTVTVAAPPISQVAVQANSLPSTSLGQPTSISALASSAPSISTLRRLPLVPPPIITEPTGSVMVVVTEFITPSPTAIDSLAPTGTGTFQPDTTQSLMTMANISFPPAVPTSTSDSGTSTPATSSVTWIRPFALNGDYATATPLGLPSRAPRAFIAGRSWIFFCLYFSLVLTWFL